MSYLRHWRKIHSEAATIALEFSSEDDCPENLDHNQCDVGDGDEDAGDGGEDVVAERNRTSQEADELRDTDSDFGYREYASTDSEEGICNVET
ncbi:hypothetical protein ABVT39_010055 [Epinephelus coioides]